MSALHDALAEYVATLRALGAELLWPATALRGFIDFVEAEGGEFITVDVALRWATRPVGIKDATRARRLGIVRGFAVWLSATDQRTQIPPRRLLPSGQRRPTPYIYDDREVADLMDAAHSLRSASGLRCHTYATLIGLLVATGLRPGEARTLDDADVDLVSGVLTVRESKFGKSRLVPIEESTRRALYSYAALRNEIRPQRGSPAFLVSGRGTRLGASASGRTFVRLCQEVGLRPRTKSKCRAHGPRLQDARHTFATRRLIAWYREGRDVERLLPALST